MPKQVMPLSYVTLQVTLRRSTYIRDKVKMTIFIVDGLYDRVLIKATVIHL